MNKLIISMLAAAALAAGGAAFAQDGGEDGQAGSAWRNNNSSSGYSVPQSVQVPNAQPDQGPRTAQEYYGNSGWTPPAPAYSGVDAWGRPYYNVVPEAAAINAPDNRAARRDRGAQRAAENRNAQSRDRDRDGDGVPNNRDRYPDDSRRW